jgi:hypothetical protein
MTKIHEIDGKKYVEVDGDAKAGDKILIVNAEYAWDQYSNGSILEVSDLTHGGITCNAVKTADDEGNPEGYITHREYRVIEEVQPDVTDIIANLARRVASLEQQLSDAQRNIERLGYDAENGWREVYDRLVSLTEDVADLDERTQTQDVEAVTFEKFLDSVAEKVAERLVGGGRQ